MCTLVVREGEMGGGDGGGGQGCKQSNGPLSGYPRLQVVTRFQPQGTQDQNSESEVLCVENPALSRVLSKFKAWSGSEYSFACFTICQDSDFPLKPSLKFTIFQHNVTCMHVNSQVNQNFTCDLMTVFHTKWPSHIYVIVYQESVNQAVELCLNPFSAEEFQL